MQDVQQEYARLIETFQNPQFTEDETDSIAIKLEEELGLAAKATRLWMSLPIDNAFSSQPAMFMAKPPGANLAVQQGHNVQWTWGNHHFMLFVAPLNKPGTGMLGLLIDDKHPVLEVYVEHREDDNALLESHQIYAMKPGVWIDDFLSYYGAFARLRVVSEATREKYRPEMEAFWTLAGI